MAFCVPNRLLSVSLKAFVVGASALLGPLHSFAQAPTIIQTFGSSPLTDVNYQFSRGDSNPAVGTNYFTGPFAENGAPGTGAYGVATQSNGGNLTVVQMNFDEKTFPVASGSAGSPNTFSLNIASIDQAGGGDRGFNTTARIDIDFSINRGGFTNQVSIIGTSANSGEFFSFVSGTTSGPTITREYNSVTPIEVSSTLRPSKVIVNLPFSNTQPTRVQVRVVISSTDKTQLLIDNVTLASGNGTSPLPVELTRFDATAKGQGVTVDWATATEKNSDRFEIQRSATGEAFETVGTVKGQGNTSSAHDYTFVDSRPLSGLSYYRLRQVDTDGTTAYSPVAAMQRHTEVAVYPNPSVGLVTLPASLGPVRYRILNTIGQTLLSGQASGNDRLDLHDLAKGTFFLELTSEAGRTTQRLVRE